MCTSSSRGSLVAFCASNVVELYVECFYTEKWIEPCKEVLTLLSALICDDKAWVVQALTDQEGYKASLKENIEEKLGRRIT